MKTTREKAVVTNRNRKKGRKEEQTIVNQLRLIGWEDASRVYTQASLGGCDVTWGNKFFCAEVKNYQRATRRLRDEWWTKLHKDMHKGGHHVCVLIVREIRHEAIARVRPSLIGAPKSVRWVELPWVDLLDGPLHPAKWGRLLEI